MKKILIMDDKDSLLRQLQTTITKFEVLTTKTVEDAATILKTEDVSFFVVDLDLGYERTGETAYDLIFSQGKSIPAIVLTGNEVSPEMKKYLLDMGFSAIIGKNDPAVTRISDAVEEAALRILEDCAERILQVRKNVERLQIEGKPLLYNSQFKSTMEWINSIANCNHVANNMKEEKEISQLIIRMCNAIERRNRDYVFPTYERNDET